MPSTQTIIVTLYFVVIFITLFQWGKIKAQGRENEFPNIKDNPGFMYIGIFLWPIVTGGFLIWVIIRAPVWLGEKFYNR